jgi:hypothetical protein
VIRVHYRSITVKTGLMIFLAFPAGLRAAGSPSHPRWAVRVSSDGHPSFIDAPNCHPLDYFAHDLGHYNYQHPLDRKQQSFLEDTFSSRPISEIAGFRVLQLEHLINDHDLTVKMLVVQRKPGEYCEIDHQERARDLVQMQPAYFAQAGVEEVLATTDAISGNGPWLAEAYWTFDKDGSIHPDVIENIAAINHKLLPKGLVVMNGGGFDIQKLTYTLPAWKASDPPCCTTGGRIQIRFARKEHQLIVVSQSFDAE